MIRVLRPSEFQLSSVPIDSKSTNSVSESASFVTKDEFCTYLAGLIYSSITSIGENTAWYSNSMLFLTGDLQYSYHNLVKECLRGRGHSIL